MKTNVRSRAFAVMVAGVMLIAGCPSSGGKGGGCTAGACIGNIQRQLTLDSSTLNYPASNPCVYQPEHVRCSNCQLNGVTVQGSGGTQVPSGIDFRHDSTLDNNRSINLAPLPWSATTAALNCATGPGCADGAYAVHLDNPNGYDCGDFGNPTLRLTLN